MTVRQALETCVKSLRAKGLPNVALDCSLLLAAAMGTDRYRVLADPLAGVPEEPLRLYLSYVNRREQFEPIQYILGTQEFMGLEFVVKPGVFIPRPESELLVEVALEELHQDREIEPLVLDPCTGSGNIAVSVAKFVPDCRVLGTDISPVALEVAAINARRHLVADRVELRAGYLLEPAMVRGLEGRASAVLCNPPYIPSGRIRDLPPEVRDYEPHQALFGGCDGLDYYGPLAAQAAALLKTNGLLAVEIDCEGASEVVKIIEQEGHFRDTKVLRDLARLDRVVCAKRVAR